MDDRPKPLSLETVFHAKYDMETAMLLCLADLQAVDEAFEDNKLYPYFAKLLNLYANLKIFTERITRIDNQREELVGIDLEDKELEYEPPNLNHEELERVLSLLDWVKPYILDRIKDGKSLQKQARENIEISEVGLIRSYLHEGYLMLADKMSQTLHVRPYQLKLYGSGETFSHDIKLEEPVEQIDISGVLPPLAQVKKQVAESHDWFKNPTTLYARPEEPLPYKSTLVPVAAKALSEYVKC